MIFVLTISRFNNKIFNSTIYFLRFFRFYTSQKIDSPKSINGVTENTLKIMHDTSYKKLYLLIMASIKNFTIENFYEFKKNQKSKFLIFVLKILIFVSISYSLSLRVQFPTIFIFDLTILLSAQNRYPKLSNRTSRLSVLQSELFSVYSVHQNFALTFVLCKFFYQNGYI